MRPLILSLQLDAASFERLDDLRRAHFPPHRNQLSAHLTLFHALPGEREAEIRADLDSLCARTAKMALGFPDLRFLGKGVAVNVEAAEVVALRRELSARWRPLLGAQDAQTIRPHVTICNKVTPEAARALFERLSRLWEGFTGQGVGVSLWEYRGGPWERLHQWEFSGP